MEATLYSIPGSHPATGVSGMLRHKGIEYKRVDLMPVISRGVLKAMRFPGVTVPSLRLDGRKLTGSRQISRALDEAVAEPPLFPADPERRAAVEETELWGEEVLADGVRRILWNAIKRDKSPLRSFAEGARLGVPIGLAVATAAPIIAAEVRINGADDDAVRADVAAVPGWVEEIDRRVAEGVIGAEEPNAADFQIAGAAALAMTMHDLRPAFEGHAAAGLVSRLAPDFPGDVPPVLPAEWLEPLRASARA